MNSKMNITLTLPGKIVDVSDNNEITLEFPALDLPIVSATACEVLTKGLTQLDGEILLERIGHFAMTESLRCRIKMGCISTIKSESRPLDASDIKWKETQAL